MKLGTGEDRDSRRVSTIFGVRTSNGQKRKRDKKEGNGDRNGRFSIYAAPAVGIGSGIFVT
jgi:hypothetical protein